MPVTVKSLVAAHAETADVITDLDRQLTQCALEPDAVFVFYSQYHDDLALAQFLRTRLPGVPVLGGTSSHGLADSSGLHDGQPVGLLLVADPDGMYGAAAAELGDDPAAAAEGALQRALADADAIGELPEVVWVYQALGFEELVLEGLQRVVGDRCPIIGGTAADDNLIGHWRQLGPDGPMSAGVVVGVLFPSGGISFAYQGGYEPTGSGGIVTDTVPMTVSTVSGDNSLSLSREIVSIDGDSAAEIYDRWRGGVLDPMWRERGERIHLKSANDPLGVEVGSVDGVSYFQLIHPAAVTPSGHLLTYAAISNGARVYAMRGSREGLIRRAHTVVATANTAIRGTGNEVAGGLVMYCAGCRLAVGDGIDEVVDALRAGFGDCDFIGCFTGGEQGPVLGRNMTSNLMISAIVFGR